MPIRVLEPGVASKIAAGEVVERPASIVKELVENSIDAGATAVTVDLIEGGLRQIRVTDNGCGMDYEDAKLAFLRHATSKIAEIEDIGRIATLGFRGEALYSIGAVAMVELITRQADSESGTLVRMEGTTLREHRVIGSPQGTSVVVKNLFYNTPARLKFMKKAGLEAAYAADIVIRLMLAHPEIAVRFVSNGRTLYQTTGDGSLQSALLCIYGKELLGELSEVNETRGEITVSGMIGSPRIARPNRTRESFFVNGRYVRSQRLSLALEQAYRTRLMQHRYPLCALNIEIPPDRVDVNISPSKLEIRFRDEPQLVSLLSGAVQKALDKNDMHEDTAPTEKTIVTPTRIAPETDASEQTDNLRFGFEGRPARALEVRESGGSCINNGVNAGGGEKTVIIHPEQVQTGSLESIPPLQPEPAMPEYRVVGQLFNTYLVVEMGQTMYIVDQHAAHERILYDKYCDLIEKGNIPSQQLLIPEVVALSPQEFAQLEPALGNLAALGFEIELFGGYSVRIRALPYILGHARMEDFLRELSQTGVSKDPVTLRQEKIAKLACKNAIKAGDTPSADEMDALFALVLQKGDAITCPHGRPVMFAMTQKALEKTFGRIVT
ncbi:MAG: DNA mismatch repair endonuclease MutL [Bacillota bacterium]